MHDLEFPPGCCSPPTRLMARCSLEERMVDDLEPSSDIAGEITVSDERGGADALVSTEHHNDDKLALKFAIGHLQIADNNPAGDEQRDVGTEQSENKSINERPLTRRWTVADLARDIPVPLPQGLNAENLLSGIGFGERSAAFPSLDDSLLTAAYVKRATARLKSSSLPGRGLNACQLLGIICHPLTYDQSKVLGRFNWDRCLRWAEHAKRTGMRIPL